tara:strand:+ start:685 stop:1062 length:378 start_codon:yes stop_codon:yes gene_type:complete
MIYLIIVVLFVNLLFKNTILILYNMDDKNLKQIETFLSTYENTLKNIFITAENEHGKGILIVDINSKNQNKCDTNYIPIDKMETFWAQSNDMAQVKNNIEINTEKKIFLCVVNNETSIILNRPYI